eukprot:CAMPEP_0167818752 /NCGR_PEP_ID=MMETSP0112_2-20121227/5000_1 /TAXON_ID=91324 /ORGANISM="Lotharella globosa, Strain CCCM811" /LENGTH=120 /DNA_ID=CAMNT_0007718813 /DNA_START=144 /DNA_END=503 /DNA_ORIENTATION=+
MKREKPSPASTAGTVILDRLPVTLDFDKGSAPQRQHRRAAFKEAGGSHRRETSSTRLGPPTASSSAQHSRNSSDIARDRSLRLNVTPALSPTVGISGASWKATRGEQAVGDDDSTIVISR